MIKRRVKLFLGALFFVAIVIWLKFLYMPIVTDDQGVRFQVPMGATVKSISNSLYFQNIIQYPILFNLLVRLRGDDADIKAGEYLFPKGTTPSKMIDQMISGSGMIYHAFTIIAGDNFRELRATLSKEPALHHTVQTLSDAEVMKQLGHSELKPEGQFFPDTYYFSEGSSDIALLKRAFLVMQEKLNTAWKNRSADLPYKTPYEILIAASLIEREAYLDIERPIISGVIVNRLRRDMLLQIDPTVIYDMGSRYTGKIYKEDLLRNTPHNTYFHKGLPPTPICMPGLESLKAAANPDANNYLYFVARGDGSHQFSKNLADHNAAVSVVKKPRLWFFNTEIVKYYLLKLVTQKIFQ